MIYRVVEGLGFNTADRLQEKSFPAGQHEKRLSILISKKQSMGKRERS